MLMARPPGPLAGPHLTIGLLNIMPRTAMRSTERQVARLLAEASGEAAVRLRRFRLDLADDGASDGEHETLAGLMDSTLDGLIVTGAMPQAPTMEGEPAWASLGQVLEWARHSTLSTIWCCLAAQAAVLRLDGVARRALPEKLSGVFACEAAIEHPLLSGLPRQWVAPHSRLNDIDEAALRDTGYTILSRGPQVGADLFGKQVGGSAFLFIQGHPEYAPDTLYREYRRDVLQFIRGERLAHPALPEAYFASHAATALDALRQQATAAPDLAQVALLDAAAGPFGHPWHQPAVQLYANWLSFIAARRPAMQWSGR